MNYPFEFKEMLITDHALDALGFQPYWSGCGDFGDRRLDLGGQVGDPRLTSKGEYPRYFIMEMDEMDQDEGSGQGYGEPYYCPRYWLGYNFRNTLYFLHEMYEDIVERRTPEEVEVFIAITKKKNVNMWEYLKSYLEWKGKQNQG